MSETLLRVDRVSKSVGGRPRSVAPCNVGSGADSGSRMEPGKL